MAYAVCAAAKAASQRGGMKDGNTWLFNDPYEGGTHANVISPQISRRLLPDLK